MCAFCIECASQPKLALSLPIKGPSYCRLTLTFAGLSVKFYSVGKFYRNNKRGKPPLEWKCYNFRAQIKQRKGFPHGYYNKNWRNLE